MSAAHVVISDLGPTFGMLAFGLDALVADTGADDPLIGLAATVAASHDPNSDAGLEALLAADRVGNRHPRAHACAAALRGGAWFSASQHPARADQLSVSGLVGVLVTPEFDFDPKTLTNALPRQVHTQKHARQSAIAAGLVRALERGNLDLVAAIFDDALIGPSVGSYLPGYHPSVVAARSAGALMVGLSNRGPAIGAICRDDGSAAAVADAIASALEGHAVPHRSVVSPVATGAAS